jgi:hypothetical protein
VLVEVADVPAEVEVQLIQMSAIVAVQVVAVVQLDAAPMAVKVDAAAVAVQLDAAVVVEADAAAGVKVEADAVVEADAAVVVDVPQGRLFRG